MRHLAKISALTSAPASRRKFLSLAVGLLLGATALAQTVSKSYQLRAVFLFRFTQFVDWPADAFATPESPITIGILGEDPFGDALALAIKGETAHGRSLQIVHFRRVEEVKNCHVLYICESESSRIQKIMQVLDNRPILTVSDIDGFARDYKGIVRFLASQNKIVFRINPEEAKAARLVLDARLLRMAQIVPK
jgi:hypothetical protein